MLEVLRRDFPLVSFTRVNTLVNPRNEDAFYPLGCPKPEVTIGDFIRIANKMGGADTVRASNIDAIERLASWHQEASVRRGF